ncbi:MAG: polysaccharide deacetylase [Anaerocolumna sp.]
MSGKKKYNQKPNNTGSFMDTNNTDNIDNTNKGKKKKFKGLLIMEAIILCIVVISYAYMVLPKHNKGNDSGGKPGNEQSTGDAKDNNTAGDAVAPTLTPEEQEQQSLLEEQKETDQRISELIAKADRMALGYDYDGAIDLIKSFGDNYTDYEPLTKAVAGYEATKSTLDPLGAYDSVNQINHIFFHTLIADTKKAFDGDYDSNGYDYYMTTTGEFNEMMQQMYDDGYVIVSIHDVAKTVKGADGETKFEPGDIMLPPDKKPFVISQDDVCYYEYMNDDGFASRIVIDENGRPSTEMKLDDGTVSVGDYDMVPLLETFIDKHPDFSYKGAKGIIALTGYEGSMGYRTNDPTSPTYEQDRETVKKIAKVMKEWGWEFASHSYGHRDMGKATYSFTVKDTDRWMKEVGSLIGPTDIYIFPFGIDMETTMGHYSSDKFKYLKSLGFDYFCGVYKDPWIQVRDDYVRMTRRPLDGQAMLQFPDRLADLFDLSKVIDKSRPALK